MRLLACFSPKVTDLLSQINISLARKVPPNSGLAEGWCQINTAYFLLLWLPTATLTASQDVGLGIQRATRKGPSSIPVQSIWDLSWQKGALGQAFLPVLQLYPLTIPFHQCSIFSSNYRLRLQGHTQETLEIGERWTANSSRSYYRLCRLHARNFPRGHPRGAADLLALQPKFQKLLEFLDTLWNVSRDWPFSQTQPLRVPEMNLNQHVTLDTVT